MYIKSYNTSVFVLKNFWSHRYLLHVLLTQKKMRWVGKIDWRIHMHICITHSQRQQCGEDLRGGLQGWRQSMGKKTQRVTCNTFNNKDKFLKNTLRVIHKKNFHNYIPHIVNTNITLCYIILYTFMASDSFSFLHV